jgi:hypothetical protein
MSFAVAPSQPSSESKWISAGLPQPTTFTFSSKFCHKHTEEFYLVKT